MFPFSLCSPVSPWYPRYTCPLVPRYSLCSPFRSVPFFTLFLVPSSYLCSTCSPVSPCSLCSPFSPCSPLPPCSLVPLVPRSFPCYPCSPVAPIAPVTLCSPCSPSYPVPHCYPFFPLDTPCSPL